jgi:hypothetical protein
MTHATLYSDRARRRPYLEFKAILGPNAVATITHTLAERFQPNALVAYGDDGFSAKPEALNYVVEQLTIGEQDQLIVDGGCPAAMFSVGQFETLLLDLARPDTPIGLRLRNLGGVELPVNVRLYGKVMRVR